jgi:hypothetical protein
LDKIFKKRYLESTKSTWNWIWSYFAWLIAKIHKWEIFVVNSTKEDWTNICVKLPLKLNWDSL